MSSTGSLSPPPRSPELPPVNENTGAAGPRLTASGAPRKKPGPKPKPKDPNAPEKKPRKPRKPAEPKDPNAEPAPRKRRTKASTETPAQASARSPAEQNVMRSLPPPQSVHTELPPLTKVEAGQTSSFMQAPATLSNAAEAIHSNPTLSHMTTAPSTPRPASSGQRYDPVRGGVFEQKPVPAIVPPPVSPPMNRASASPSITSLIDPPNASNTSYAHPVRPTPPSVTSAAISPVPHVARPGSLFPGQDQQQASTARTNPSFTTAMEIDSEPSPISRPGPTSVPMKKTNSNTTSNPCHSNAPTPPPSKLPRQKEAPPPMPMGSGLLSGTAFGPMGATSTTSTEPQGVSVCLNFDLTKTTNNVYNFAQEAEKIYGFQALHPKLAARKERLRQVTAAGAALEKAAGAGSTEESLDLSEPESNTEMGGMEGEASSADPPKKKRKKRQEDYDKEDDFIDDTELAWSNQALMAKDGFFVWLGPLVRQGEDAQVERADGTVSKRGRGRGRGGSTRGETSGRGRGRGGGPGSRGGNTVRKPRVTKADRAQMEQEKLERERIAASMARTPLPGTSQMV